MVLYQNLALLAACLLLFSLVSGRIERAWLSGPILLSLAGYVLGPRVLGLLDLAITAEAIRMLAEAALAVVLFCDAANADLGVVRRVIRLPERLLLLGLPLTILLGFGLAALIFPQLDVLELALLAAMLAPTDAALGKPVVVNPAVPASIRESLNLESGLNDGICVPVIVILLSFAVGTQIEHTTLRHVLAVVVEEIGIGLLAGVLITAAAAWLLRRADAQEWIAEGWTGIPAIAIAASCFTAAQAIGGSGFIASFTGGLLFSWIAPVRKHALLRGAEASGETLGLLVWCLFGAAVLGPLFTRLTWPVFLYGLLSLTVIRMVPVWLCLIGAGLGTAEKLFIGWFGPRGLASIVFAIIVLDEKLPGTDTLMEVVACTVLLSIVAHGMTAIPLIRRLASGAPPAS